ncbi:MAG: hypothetical protein WD029_02030, partial [Microthrixaceae bacterium]
TEALLPSLREYTATFGLTSARADRMAEGSIIMHPGPMNRGVEIASEVADRPAAVITEQVSNGVAVRSAVLFTLLSSAQLGMHSEPAFAEPAFAEPLSTSEETE